MKVKAKIKTNDFDGLNKSLREYANNVCTEASNIIASDLDMETVSAIRKFYSSYTPHVYDRHYYNFLENSHRPFVTKVSNLYVGGVELNYAFLEDLYDDPEYTVFENTFAGYHGSPEIANKYGIPRMMPSPMDIIFMRRDELINNQIDSILSLATFRVRY